MASDRTLFQGRRLRLIARPIGQSPDGAILEKEMLVHPPSVAIVAAPDPRAVVLIENARPATGETLLEVPAGGVDPGETAEEAAHRELREETGFSARAMRPIGSFYLAPGYSSELMTVFFAEGLTGGPAHQQLMPDERIQVRVTSVAEAMEAVRTSRIRDAKSIAALTLATMHGVLRGD